MKPVVRYEKDITFSGDTPFPTKILLSKNDTPTASARLSMLNKGDRIDVHAHADSDQIEYCISGKALMFIEGLGEKEIVEGTFTYIPKGVKHGIISAVETTVFLTIFVPPLF
jgi:quercetin dioxygenase-like cupin family protein